MIRSRGIAVVLIAALLTTMGVVDRDRTGPARRPFGQPSVSPIPIADRSDVLASTWYCAGGTSIPNGAANLTVVIANTATTRATGTVTWYPSKGGPVARPLDVPATGSLSVAARDSVDAPVVSAIVDIRGGGIAVEHVVSGARGASVAPCASDASPTWYFANGSTERDAVQVLALFNPFPDDAIVDITFASEEGRDQPAALAGLPVAAGTTTLVNVHDNVRRRAATATAVVARSGRLVVDRLQSFDGSLGRRGVSLTLGAPSLSESWTFPEGLWTDGVTQQWHVFNPTDREAQVELQVTPASGDPIQPVDLTVPAKSQIVIDAAKTSGVASGIAHTSTITSLNGVPIVAERSIDARSPSRRRGWSSSLGSPIARPRWVLPLGEASGNTDEWVVVHNPNPHAVTASLSALVGGQLLAVEGMQDVKIGPGGRVALRLGDHIERSPLPLLVDATGDVVVERDLYRVGAPGITTLIGIPLS
ncbi:MAG: hypothetical protein QOI47_1286 [Actinomycetota bacterium]|nr:hypothetical protein [Actinomycetota bacterium]